MEDQPTDQITEFTLENTYGIPYIKFGNPAGEPFTVIRVLGKNGSGKSSLVNGLLAPFFGGKDASIIRAGTNESKVQFKTAAGYTVTQRTWKKKKKEGAEDGETGMELQILDPHDTKVDAPATYLKRFADSTAIDPGAILRIDASKAAGRKELAAMLMRMVPMTFETKDVAQALQVQVVKAKPGKISSLTGDKWVDGKATTVEPAVTPPTGIISLPEIRKVIKSVADRRQRVGSTKEEAEGSINRLRASLPSEEVVDYSASITAAQDEQNDLAQEEMGAKLLISQKVARSVHAATDDFWAASQNIDTDIEARIKSLEAERFNSKCVIQEALDVRKLAAETERMNLLAAAENEFRPKREEITAKLATLREQAKGEDRADALRGEIESQTRTARESARLWDQLTEAKERLEGMAKAKLDSLPVQGLEVADDRVLVDGIQWQFVNTARKVQIAVQVCAQLLRRLGWMVLDNCEMLDSQTRVQLEQEIVDSGYQLVEAMVDDTCMCGHEHLGQGGPNQMACLQCDCKTYTAKPLRIEIVAPAMVE